MSVAFSVRTPAQIASEINNIKHKTDKMILQNCVQIGCCLTEAKAVLAHGEWGKWLKEAVSYSERTANYLMQIYREFGPKPASRTEACKSATGCGFRIYPGGHPFRDSGREREEFMACHDVENMSKGSCRRLSGKRGRRTNPVLKEREAENLAARTRAGNDCAGHRLGQSRERQVRRAIRPAPRQPAQRLRGDAENACCPEQDRSGGEGSKPGKALELLTNLAADEGVSA